MKRAEKDMSIKRWGIKGNKRKEKKGVKKEKGKMKK